MRLHFNLSNSSIPFNTKVMIDISIPNIIANILKNSIDVIVIGTIAPSIPKIGCLLNIVKSGVNIFTLFF